MTVSKALIALWVTLETDDPTAQWIEIDSGGLPNGLVSAALEYAVDLFGWVPAEDESEVDDG